MNQKKAVLIFPYFSEIHIYKDVGMIPKYLSLNKIECIIYSKNSVNNKDFKIKIIKKNFFFLNTIFDLIKNSKDIDYLLLYHTAPSNFFFILTYKLFNRKGVTHIVADMSESILELNKLNLLNIIRRIKIFLNFSIVDKVSIEQKRILNYLQKRYPSFSNKMCLIPLGYGDTLNIKRKNFKNKKNIIIIVGRVSYGQKASDIALQVIKKLNSDLKNWEVIFIGKIFDDFKPYITKFFIDNADLKSKIKFVGYTKTRKEMLDYYNNAKIIFIPSRFEGYSNIVSEAAYFGNVIVGTPVGGVMDLTENGKYGAICQIDDINSMFFELKKRINDNKLLEHESNKIQEICEKNYLWSDLIKKLIKHLEN